MIEFGTLCKDVITGFEGVATGKADYISGCNQILLAPKLGPDGAFRDSQWFDAQRVVMVPGGNVISLNNEGVKGPDRMALKR